MLLAIPASIVYTALHELAHCTATWLQGGKVTRFIWIPTEELWGEMSYEFPAGDTFSDAAISGAPCILWTACCFLALALSLRRKAWPFWAASSIFVWLFLAPISDTAYAALAQIRSVDGTDLTHVFGAPSFAVTLGYVLYGLMMTTLGFFTQRQLYRERALPVATFCLLGALALIILAGIPLL